MDINQIGRKGRVSRQQLEEMSEVELLDLKSSIDYDIVGISSQLENARANVHSSGEYADPNWYMRATIAKRLKGQASQAIQNELGRRRKAKGPNQDFTNALLEAMDKLLTPEMKSEILEFAKSKRQTV